jgi:predicted RNA-binding Zn ribbon-like protein
VASAASTDAEPGRFEFSGGALCLDFANTVGDRPEATKDLLKNYADLLAWSLEAGLLDARECRKLSRRASRNPAEAQGAFSGAIEVRETLHRIYAALARGRQPDRGDLEGLNDDLGHALPFVCLVATDAGFRWTWSGETLDRPLWPVIRSAADLLTSDEVALVRECDSGTCSWLFIDRSRTRCRRWCDMKTCGNRQKARRYYRRHKSGAGTSR